MLKIKQQKYSWLNKLIFVANFDDMWYNINVTRVEVIFITITYFNIVSSNGTN